MRLIALLLLLAHHSIAGAYDSSKPVTLDGAVTEFHWVNPHPYVIVQGKARGANDAQTWRLEMDNRGELAAVGMSQSSLRPGDQVTVTGSLSRTQANSLYIRSLERAADGFIYEQVGSSPRVRRR